MTTETLFDANVMFVGDWFSMNVTVTNNKDDEDAILNAAALIENVYGWNVYKASYDITVERDS